MPRKKSATAKAREANGDPHPKEILESKKAVLDLDSDSDADSSTAATTISVSRKRKASEEASDSEEPAFKINEEYAKRFEHNKKREELHRLEEKYGKSAASKRRKTDGSDDDSLDSDEESSSSEDEDEIGELVTSGIDAQIQATINAIRSKDPRVYDNKSKFFDGEEEEDDASGEMQKEKSMTLKQYHQKNIMEGYTGEDDDADAPPRTYIEEQEYLKRTVVGEMHAAAEGSGDEEDGFLIRKEKPVDAGEDKALAVALPENPDEDPEGFLNAFFSKKAWVPKDAAGEIPFESDDSEEEDMREEFEQAYNMRFEDPAIADRSKIITHARDVAKQKSLRRQELSRRKKARDEKKERERREKDEKDTEKNRLRKLRVEEMEKKLKMVQEAGGLDIQLGDSGIDEKWKKLLDGAWEGDEGWEKRMAEVYGDDYYKKKDDLEGDKKLKKPKKPTWDDEIDINDLVPDFKEAESASDGGDNELETQEQDASAETPKSDKPKKKEKKDKRANRLLRAQIESYVDDKLPVSLPGSSKKSTGFFRYREVTPESFQLTPTDILFAGDKQLNSYAGLKKLASFRDDSKKAKDRKRYSKGKGFKLREWRKEVFGKPEINWDELNGGAAKEKSGKKESKAKGDEVPETTPAEKKKKRRRKNKGNKEAVDVEA
ncbi:hypothetical protein ABW19_dt0202625 [Dactylella cylindrospora]|nr:hypothetical protein ABW19_dt0202625 [Dactylella cylindrospora]